MLSSRPCICNMQRDQLLHPHKLSAPHTRKHYTVNYMHTHTHTHTHTLVYHSRTHVYKKQTTCHHTCIPSRTQKTNYMSPHLYKPLKGICVYKKKQTTCHQIHQSCRAKHTDTQYHIKNKRIYTYRHTYI